MISRDLLETLFSAFSIERWNDHPRPVRLVEMDKQAHKGIIAFLVARSDGGLSEEDLPELAEALVFEFLQRVVLTDLKPPVFYRLMESAAPELNRWVLDQWERPLEELSPELFRRFGAYLEGWGSRTSLRAVTGAANYLATSWEHQLIHPLAAGLFGAAETRRELRARLEEHMTVPLVRHTLLRLAEAPSSRTCDFVDLVAQLRFQKRWTRIPRIPETSVLGHMFFVALLGYLLSLELGLSPRRRAWNFFAGLFHDLPEVLTRDVISPVKKVAGLEGLLKGLERDLMGEKVYPLLPHQVAADLRFFTEEEFVDRARSPQGEVRPCPEEEEGDRREGEGWTVVDGRLLDWGDKFAAYLEAALSVRYGVKPELLTEACESLREGYGGRPVRGRSFAYLFDAFR